jgi:glutamate synthase (NADPH) small chain
MGHPVSLIEARKELGGLLRFGIPLYRLPQAVLEKDLERIRSLDIDVRTGQSLGAKELEVLRAESSAIFLASGAQRSLRAEIRGVDLEGVFFGLYFLSKVRRSEIGEMRGRVVVIGGGNVAVDAARSASRLGAEKVEVVCLEQRGDMSAHEGEWGDALEEGILLHNGWGAETCSRKEEKGDRCRIRQMHFRVRCTRAVQGSPEPLGREYLFVCARIMC